MQVVRLPAETLPNVVTLLDKTVVSGCITDGEVHVEATGTKYGLAEVAEQLMWVSTALHTSKRDDTQQSQHAPNAYINSCQMEVRGGATGPSLRTHWQGSHVGTVNITVGYETKPLDHVPELSNGSCWHRLFRNCEITTGYPIPPRRLEQPGLDIPLDMMADLIRAERVTQFGLNLVILGFSSLLYAADYQDGVILWHLICNHDGSQVSFSDPRVPLVASPKELLPSPQDVGRARHIVGWTNKVQNLTGTRSSQAKVLPLKTLTTTIGAIDASYNIKASKLSPPAPDFAMERLQITAEQFITIGTSFIRGYRDKPVQVEQKNFPLRLINLGEKYFVLHDAGTRKAWLVDGLSTLLHLLRYYLAEAAKPNDYSSTFLNPFPEPIEGQSIRQAAYNTLVHDANLKLHIHAIKSTLSPSGSAPEAERAKKDEESGVLSIQGCIETILHILEQICGHHDDRREDRSIGSRIRALPETRLVGFDFKDIAKLTTILFPKATDLSPGGDAWVGLTRAIRAPVLFGRDFGELLLPTVPHEVACMMHHWNGPSPAGQDTLAVSLVELRRIADIGDREEIHFDTPLHLEEDYYLEISAQLFSECSLVGGHHRCKERLTRVSRGYPQGAQDRLTKPERAPWRFWAKFKQSMSHSNTTRPSITVVPNEGAVLLGMKRLRRHQRDEAPKQPREVKQEDSERSQASSSRFNMTGSARSSERISETTPTTEFTQSAVPSDQISTPSSYRSAESQWATQDSDAGCGQTSQET